MDEKTDNLTRALNIPHKIGRKQKRILREAQLLRQKLSRAFDQKNFNPDRETEYRLYELWEYLEYFWWTYPAKYKEVKLRPDMRLGTLISGALFTSEAHPWPLRANKLPAEPICQVDLAGASRIGGEDLGEGLLQFWQDGFDSETRFIPKDDLKITHLTDIPKIFHKKLCYEDWYANRFMGLDDVADAVSEWEKAFC